MPMTRITTSGSPGRDTEDTPLVLLGPGGSFVGEYRDASDPEPIQVRFGRAASPGVALVTLRCLGAKLGFGRCEDNPLALVRRDAPLVPENSTTTRVDARAACLGLIVLCEKHLLDQEERIAGVHRALRRASGAPNAGPGVERGFDGRVRPNGAPTNDGKDRADEPDSQATQNPPAHPRLADPAWLFPDHAGTRRRDRRQQGHGLRARRGAHQEGRAHPRGQQGTLFVDR